MFSTCPLKPLNGIQRNLTGSKISTPSTKFVFFGLIGKTRWQPGLSLAETFSTSPLKPLSKLSMPSTTFVFFRQIGKKQNGRSGLWLAETFSTFPLKLLKGIWQNLIGSKISMPSTKFVFFRWIGKTRWPPWPLIGWDIFPLLLWNRWMEFNKTWQEARSQRHLPSLCFSGWSEKQDGHPGLWLSELFSTYPLKPPNGIQQNLTRSMISMSSTKFVFFGPIWKTRWPPWPPIGWDIFDFSVETTDKYSTNLDRKQDLNALYQVCVFRADRKNKMAAWPLIGRDIFDFSSETTEPNSTKLDRKQDLNALYHVCVFRADRKKNGRRGLWLAEIFSTSPLTPLNGIQQNLTGSKLSMPSTTFVFFRQIGKKQNGRPCLWLAETFSTFPLKPLKGIWRNLIGSKISTPSTKFVFFRWTGKTKWPPRPLICWDIFNFSSETAE